MSLSELFGIGRQQYLAYCVGMDELAGLPEEARRLALDRFRLLQPHLEQNEPLTSVAKAAGIPYRTAHRLVSQYRRHGLAALVRKKRLDRGQRRAVSGLIARRLPADGGTGPSSTGSWTKSAKTTCSLFGSSIGFRAHSAMFWRSWIG